MQLFTHTFLSFCFRSAVSLVCPCYPSLGFQWGHNRRHRLWVPAFKGTLPHTDRVTLGKSCVPPRDSVFPSAKRPRWARAWLDLKSSEVLGWKDRWAEPQEVGGQAQSNTALAWVSLELLPLGRLSSVGSAPPLSSRVWPSTPPTFPVREVGWMHRQLRGSSASGDIQVRNPPSLLCLLWQLWLVGLLVTLC